MILASLSSWYDNQETLIQTIAIYALLAFSIQVALRSGIFSLAGIGFYAIGSYGAGVLTATHGWHAVPAIAAAVIGCAVLGWLLARLLVRLRDLYLAMATVAFDLMVGVIALNWKGVTGGPIGLFGIPLAVTTLTLVLTVVVVAALLYLMEHGTVGRTLEVVREDEQLAQSFAVDTGRYRRLAFVVSSMLGGLAGAYHALVFNTVSPGDAGFNLIVLALTMVIIGGFGSWIGALVGAILIAWLPLKLEGFSDWWYAIYGGIMILMATFIPGGLYGVARQLGRWSRAALGRRGGGGTPAAAPMREQQV
jgi:branched-chain amino acid transport system permease protein